MRSLSQENISSSKSEPSSEREPEIPGEKNEEPTRNPEDNMMQDLEKHLSRKSTRKNRLGPEIYPLMDLDNGLVGWDSQDDPRNPRNFDERKKWFILFLIAAITFLSPLTSSIFAPGVGFVNEEFDNTSALLGSFSVSVFVLGFAIGPLFLSSLSEIYGRRIVLSSANVFFCAFNLGCALAPNLAGLIVLRLFAGMGGSACLTIGTGVISDVFFIEQRGKANALYSMGILFGPVIGPIMGGFIAQRAGWRWDFWVVFIAGCVISAGILILYRETNPIVLIDWKTKKLQKELNRPELQNAYTHKENSSRTKSTIIAQGIMRPLKMLLTSPIIFLLSLYVAFVFGLLYLLFTTITSVYMRTYGWSAEITGLAYLGVGLGFLMGLTFVARTSDATIIAMTKRNNGVYEPEMRLPTCVFFGFLIPISLFWYGWTTDKHVHWIVPIIGLIPFGFGMTGIFSPIQTYLIDAYPRYAASAAAGIVTMRCIVGAVLPLGGPSMYKNLGLGWGNSLLGFVAVGMIPLPALIYKYGGLVRKKYPLKL